MPADNVVYVLGAGFSAPLGLPVTTNFFDKSHELFAAHSGDLSYFEEIYEEVRRLHVVKGVFSSDLRNIEEILSLLEMETLLRGEDRRSAFVQFIRDVIQRLTPTIVRYESALPGNWNDWFFGRDSTMRAYGAFVAGLFSLAVTRDRNSLFACTSEPENGNRYAVVTFNYDMVLENLCEFLATDYDSTVKFSDQSTPLTKLHGSVDDGDIVPPTWNKGLHQEFVPRWQAAYNLLARAHHIRIIGYSLPEADLYVRYLLKAAIASSQHLKTIDVLCRDSSSREVEQRYDAFVDSRGFRGYRFVNGDVRAYLDAIDNKKVFDQSSRTMKFYRMEEAHEGFFQGMVHQ